MQHVIIVIHLMLVLALIGVVLLQRSEGGGLGIGSTGGFMTSRGTANVLTRATALARATGLTRVARRTRMRVPLLGFLRATARMA